MNYPNGIKKVKQDFKIDTKHGNRGMNLEKNLNLTHQYYLENNLAFIYKKPTPIKIGKVNYNTMTITEAFFESPSTTDYNGLYKGKYIDFEAKETKSKTAFPIQNIHNHQLIHMKNIMNNNGISFIIVSFVSLNKTYLLFSKDLFDFLDKNNKKSIPHKYFIEKGYLIEERFQPRLNYLEIIDQLEDKNG